MALINLRNVNAGYGGEPVLAGIDLQIEQGERICLLGRNGSGKSTLLKLITGQLPPESGEITRQIGLRVTNLLQEVPQELAGSVYDVVAAGLGETGEALAQYHRVSREAELHPDQAHLDELHELQHVLDARSAWPMHQEIVTVLSKMSLPGDEPCQTLSAGMKRRVLLAAALVSRPDLLLLDEPTNHLDLGAILWLEEFLLECGGTPLFVTHDRAFLQRLSTRILEVDRGGLRSWLCDYQTYVERKADLLEAEAHERQVFDKKLASEEEWERQGVKARRARNEGRRRALAEMRQQRADRKDVPGTAKLLVQGAPASGRLVIEAKNVRFAYGENLIVSGFSTRIMRGEKIGIIGPNGSGKSTLLKLLLGELAPQHGTIRQGTRLEIAYFDQLHAQLDETLTVQQNVAGSQQTITVNGRSRHVLGYLNDFLFSTQRARSPITDLSGGERNRLLLAKLMTRPANLLVLDEPTNDLDAETLELLEDLLVEFPGTVLMVSHDREFLNNVVTSVLVLEGEGKVGEYVGGYDDWLRQKKLAEAAAKAAEKEKSRAGEREEGREQGACRERLARADGSHPPAPAKKRLSFKEQRELEALPGKIEQLEARQREIHDTMAGASFYRKPPSEIAALKTELAATEAEMEQAFERWQELCHRSEAG